MVATPYSAPAVYATATDDASVVILPRERTDRPLPPISAEALGEMTDADLRCLQRYGETTSVRYAATLVLIGRASTDLAVLA